MSRDDREYEGEEPFRGTGTPQMPEGFVDQEAVANALAMERATHVDESTEDLTHRLFKENSPNVAMQLVNIALRGSNERLRLDAGKYIIDRVMGPVGKETYRADSPLDAMVRQMQRDAEDAANKAYDNEE
jgi:hypothetical protein